MPTADMTAEVYDKLMRCCTAELYDDFLKIGQVRLVKSSDNTCSLDREDVVVYFEGSSITLAKEISNRIDNRDPFTEPESMHYSPSLSALIDDDKTF